MKLIKHSVLGCLAIVWLVCSGCGTSNNTQGSFKIVNVGKEIVVLEETLPDRVAKIQLGECGSRTFLGSEVVSIGQSEIRVKDTRVEVAHKGKDTVTLNYVDASGRERVMMLGNGGIGFFENPRSIVVGTVQICLVGNEG